MFVTFPNMLKKGDEVIILDPMYGEYTHILQNVIGARINLVKQDKKNGFKININNILKAVSKKTKMIVLVNPNNPTGQYIEKKEMIKLVAKIPKNIFLFIDETYIDYIGKKESMETEIKKYPNLIILKSMSKIYALSGVRVGYLVAGKQVISKLSLFNPPWSVGLLGQLAGTIALRNESYYREKLNETKKINDWAQKELSKIDGLKPIKSLTNFILIELTNSKLSASKICKNLEGKGIFIRNPQSQSTQLKDNFIRISIKDKSTTKKIIDAIKKEIK